MQSGAAQAEPVPPASPVRRHGDGRGRNGDSTSEIKEKDPIYVVLMSMDPA